MGLVGGRPLRGRRRELAVISEALTRAAAGTPSTIVLVGEPGIGKTRLASEVAVGAATAGFATWWGRAWEAGGAPAYWPWRQLCELLPRDSIAQLWGAHGATTADPDQARFELFDAVTRSIAAHATRTPLLCILDDLHVADIPTLELVAFAARHLRASRVLWLLTWRDAEGARMPVRDQLVRIAREATVVPLASLTETDANQLIDDVRADADIQMRGTLVRATGGNPLFLLETLAALATGATLPRNLDQLPLAQAVAAIVRERLAPLSVNVRDLAAAASAIGRDVALARWIVAADCQAEGARAGACQLVDAGILTTSGYDRWRFSHDLVREAIYRLADDQATVTHHRRLAHALDREISAGDTSLVGERAHHALHALDDETVIAWTISAIEHARQQCAHEEAIALADRVLHRIGPPAQRDGALQLALGRAYLDHNEVAAAATAFNTVIVLARKAADPRLFAAAVLGLGARYVFGDQLHDLISLIDEAMLALPHTDRDLHARLLARKAAALTPAADPAPILEMAREASRLVADSTDDAARLEVAVAVGAALTDFAPPRECAAVNETVVALARARGERALELRGMSRLVANHIHAGDFARADALLVVRDALARSLVQRRFAWMEPMFRSLRAAIRGDFAQSDIAIVDAESFTNDDPNCARACAVHRTWMLLMADRVEELRAHEPVVLAAIRTMTPIIASAIRAAIRLRAVEPADARRELDGLEPELAHGRAPAILAMIAEVAAEVGSSEIQREVYDLLAPHSDTYAGFGPFGFTCGAPVAATLGALASALGDLDRGRAHFESALAMATRDGATVARTWTAYWYGRALARAGHPDAARHLDDAARDAARFGMQRLVIRCRETAGAALATAPTPVVATSQPALAWTIAPHGSSWLITIADRSVLAPSVRGMPLLARLAARPHIEIHSLELVAGEAETDSGDAGELLDDKARSAYRNRLSVLADKLEDAEARGDVDGAETIRDEHETLLKELSRAVGLGGRVRRAGAATERARVTAQRRLREAIRKIGELDPELAEHLDGAIRTGTFCVYRP